MTAEGPTARHGAVAVFDHALGEVVLFGGNGATRKTWAWNGTRWRQLPTGDEPGRYNAAASAGDDAMPALRVGGWDGTRRQRDAWSLRAGVWHPMPAAGGPAARNHAALAFGAVRQRHVLAGGHDGTRVFGDVWETDGRRWARVFDVPARTRIPDGH